MDNLIIVIYLIIAVAAIAGMWKLFTKAGKPGWAALIPIYNIYILLQVVGKPWWWLLLLLIPLVNIIILIVIYHFLSLSFGRGMGFTVGLLLLTPIFIAILGFGSDVYKGPAGVETVQK